MDDGWVEPELPGMGGVVADHSPDCYVEGDTLILRPSSLNRCTRSLVAQGMGMEGSAPPAKLIDRMDESAKLEAELLRKGLGSWELVPLGTRMRGVDGLSISHGQWAVTLDIGRGVRVRGHLDGLAWCPSVVHVVEGKAPGPSMHKDFMKRNREATTVDWTGFEGWAWQISAYMWATKRPAVYVVGKKSEDGKRIEETDVYFVPTPPIGLAQIRGKAALIAMLVRQGKIPETCDKKDWPCPMWWLHEDVDEQLEMVTDENDRFFIDHYWRTKRQLEIVQQELKDMKPILLERLGTGKKRAGEYTVNIWHTEVPAGTREVKAYTSTTVKIEKETDDVET